MESLTIICVDDEFSVLQSLREELEDHLPPDYVVEIAESGQEALELMDGLEDMGETVAVVIADQLMPGMKGDALLTHIHERQPLIRKILLTGQATTEDLGNAVNRAQLYRFIAKPWDRHDLLKTVEQALLSYRQEQELDQRIQLLHQLNEISITLSETIVSVPQLAETLLSSIRNLVSGAQGFLVSFDGQGGTVHALYSDEDTLNNISDLDSNPVASASIPIFEPGHDPQVFEQAQLQQLVQLYSDTNDHPLSVSISSWLQTCNSLYMAWIGPRTQPYAWLLLKHSKAGQFTQLRQEYLNILLQHAENAFESAHLYLELEKKVVERTEIIQQQRREITDNIQYARRIQYALLPDPELLFEQFPRAYILYRPKDIVSGDFYWFSPSGPYYFVAVGDCTGHGVPGAFMSVLGTSLLETLVNQEQIYEPAEVLNELSLRVVDYLNADSQGEKISDGMDISLCRFTQDSREIHYAGAQRPLAIIRGEEIIEISGDKRPVGYDVFQNQVSTNVEQLQFNTQHVLLEKDDVLVMYSDGITDQFSGNLHKKLTKRKFYKLLASLGFESVQAQRTLLEEFLGDWMGQGKQTDDILVLAIRP